MRLELPSMDIKIQAGVWRPSDKANACRTVEREEVLATLDTLAPIPQCALSILHNYQNDQYTLRDLTHDLKQDQVLSAKTIKLANSALFKRVQKVTTIEGAVSMLGRDKIIKWIVAEAIEGLFNRSQGGYSMCKGGLFHHARKIASLSESIAAASGATDPQTAYLSGLLHDIGKVVLDQYIPEVASRLYQERAAGECDFLKSERTFLGMDHTEAGACLALKWGFPDCLVDAIKYHHHPGADDLRSSTTAGIVYLADLLLAKFAPGTTVSFPRTNELINQLQKTKLSPQQLNALIDSIPSFDFQKAA
jgi:putative nucleotidyltransferase with HDIG domain